MKTTLTTRDDISSITLILSNTDNYDKRLPNNSANSVTTHPTFDLVKVSLSTVFGLVCTIIPLSLLVFIISGCNIPVNAATNVAENNFDQWSRYAPLLGTIFAALPLSLLVNTISGSNALQNSKIDESMKRSEESMKRSDELVKKFDELVTKLELSINDSVKKSEESVKKIEESQRQAYEAFKSSQEREKQSNQEILSESSKFLISSLQLQSQRIDNAIDKK